MNRRNVVRSLQLPQSREEAKYMRQNKNMKRISKAMSLTDNKYQDGKQRTSPPSYTQRARRRIRKWEKNQTFLKVNIPQSDCEKNIYELNCYSRQ